MGQLEDILKHQNMVRNNIMKSFGVEISEDSLEKSFEDEVNPFEMEAYKSELTKAELDEFEKAKHQDGDMHPNGKWVWRQSANGGKGDWRVAKPGGSKSTAGGAAATTKTNTAAKKTDNKNSEKPYIYNDGEMVGGETQIKDEAGLLKVLNNSKSNTVLIYEKDWKGLNSEAKKIGKKNGWEVEDRVDRNGNPSSTGSYIMFKKNNKSSNTGALKPKELSNRIKGEIREYMDNSGDNNDSSSFREKLYSIYEKYSENNPMTIIKFSRNFAADFMGARQGLKFRLFATARKDGANKSEAEKYAKSSFDKFMEHLDNGGSSIDFENLSFKEWKNEEV